MTLTSKQRATLKGLANPLEPLFQVGKGGISDTLLKQVDDALTARELIKVKALETAPESANETAQLIADQTRSTVVQVIGRVMVFYRRNPKNPQIKLS